MKKNFPLLILFILIFWGCSDDSSDEKTELPPTTFPPGEVTQVSLSTSDASETPVSEPTRTAPQATATAGTSTPEFLGYSIAGVEAKTIDDMRLIAQAEIHWTRINGLQWHLVEPVKGNREWAAVESLESQLREASASGIETILIVRSTPEWAQKVAGMYCGSVREDALQSMGDFIYDAVLRYSNPPYNVKYWELGNEPDVNVIGSKPNMQFGCWGDSSDVNFGGGYYAEMLKVVYPRIKSADPNAQVLIGGLLLDCDPVNPPEIPPGSGQVKDCRPATFLEGILSNSGGDYFDGVSFHAYDYYAEIEGQYGNINWHSSWDTTGPVLLAKADYVRTLLERYGYEDKFLMNTEGALICGRDGTEPVCNTDSYNATKASYLAQSYTVSRASGLKANIWYNFQGWRGSGLLDETGNPLPAYQALTFHISILEDAVFQTEIRDYEGLIGFSFESQDSIIWVLWSLEEVGLNITTDTPPDHLYDYLGNELMTSTEITINYSPSYLVWLK